MVDDGAARRIVSHGGAAFSVDEARCTAYMAAFAEAMEPHEPNLPGILDAMDRESLLPEELFPNRSIEEVHVHGNDLAPPPTTPRRRLGWPRGGRFRRAEPEPALLSPAREAGASDWSSPGGSSWDMSPVTPQSEVDPHDMDDRLWLDPTAAAVAGTFAEASYLRQGDPWFGAGADPWSAGRASSPWRPIVPAEPSPVPSRLDFRWSPRSWRASPECATRTSKTWQARSPEFGRHAGSGSMTSTLPMGSELPQFPRQPRQPAPASEADASGHASVNCGSMSASVIGSAARSVNGSIASSEKVVEYPRFSTVYFSTYIR